MTTYNNYPYRNLCELSPSDYVYILYCSATRYSSNSVSLIKIKNKDPKGFLPWESFSFCKSPIQIIVTKVYSRHHLRAFNVCDSVYRTMNIELQNISEAIPYT